jgi:hypothetical protein
VVWPGFARANRSAYRAAIRGTCTSTSGKG